MDYLLLWELQALERYNGIQISKVIHGADGKQTHTILGSRSTRGLTQLALDVLFRSISSTILDPATTASLHATVAASDPSEAQVMSAQMFLDTMYGDPAPSRASSRAPTPMVVRTPSISFHPTSCNLYPSLPRTNTSTGSPKSIRVVRADESILSQDQQYEVSKVSMLPNYDSS